MKRILITGGGGFIGSNLVESLSKDEQTYIHVLDNFCTGKESNLSLALETGRVKVFKGSITDPTIIDEALHGIDIIIHLAALGSVPRSIKRPSQSDATNVNGFVNMVDGARNHGIKKFIYASSSSVYGDEPSLTKVESTIGTPQSPYAVTKLTNETYAKVFSTLYDIDFIGLRFFNVFGKYQDPFGQYAAVIPIFVSKILSGDKITINGDGTISRDFTHVSNVIEACKLAMRIEDKLPSKNEVYNVACGKTTTLNELVKLLEDIINLKANIKYGPARPGDIHYSLASIEKIKTELSYSPLLQLHEGLLKTIDYYRSISAEA